MASVTTMPNSLNRRPTTPPIKRIGRKTATSDSVIETMVAPTSALPSSAAWNGALPISIWRMMFSSITIASSTTRPTASVRPSSEMLSIEKPKIYMPPNAATSESGTASAGMIVAVALPRKR